MRFSNILNDEKQLIRLIWLIGAAFITVAIAFGGYYYWDRYVSLDDQSPLELGVTELEDAVRENPDNPDMRLALSQFYFDSGMHEEALEQAQQILVAFPENDMAIFIAGMSQLQLGNREIALESLAQFADIRRAGPMANTDTMLETALFWMGQSYVSLGRSDEAIPVLTEALQINRMDADAMHQLGMAYTQTGQHELALEQYHEAVRFVPDFAEVFHGMIASYTALERPSYVAYARGMEAYSLEDYETARIHLQAATNDLPDFMPAYLGAGMAFERLGELETAEQYLIHATELDPDNFLASNTLSRVRLSLGKDE